MENEKDIFYLCLGTPDQKKLVSIATTQNMLKKAVETLLHYAPVSYRVDGNDHASTQEQLKQFRKDWDELSRTEINDRLNGAFIGVTKDGAMI